MQMRSQTTAEALQSLVGQVIGGPLPLALRAWDGSQAGPDHGPVVVVHNRRALRRLLWSPDELGFGRAYVAGDLDVDGDLYQALEVFLTATDTRGDPPAASAPRRIVALRDALRLGVLGLPPSPPVEEIRRGRLLRHTPGRDAAAISHHYDVGNDFYRLVLGDSMVYSCAYWAGDGPGYGLAQAQRDKLELVSHKLSLRPGMRLLDVGCGWGSMVIHAAREHGVRAVGVTISQEQADLARKRVAEEGLDHLVEIRVQDYRDVRDGPYDAICSIGMAEHVGRAQLMDYARGLLALLRPEGRLLHHAIADRRDPDPESLSFIEAYVFPNGELSRIGDTVSTMERAGFEVRDVQSLREHYGLTLRQWVHRLEDRWDQVVEMVGQRRARIWRLYMIGSAVAFDAGRVGVDQVVAVKPDRGRSGMPLVRERWLEPLQ